MSQLTPLVTAAAPQLVALPGVGVDTAGQLLVTAGDNSGRLRSERSFARLRGVAPVPASSGHTGPTPDPNGVGTSQIAPARGNLELPFNHKATSHSVHSAFGTVCVEPRSGLNLRTALKEAVRHGGTSKMKPCDHERRYPHPGRQPVYNRYMKGPSEADGRLIRRRHALPCGLRHARQP